VDEVLLRQVREVMDPEPPAVDKDVSLSHAVEAAEKAKTDRVVLLEGGEVRGILTLRNVIFKLATVRTKSATPTAMHASSFASEPVVSVAPGDPLARSLRAMSEGGFTSTPVVEGGLEGLISRWEIAGLLADTPAAAGISVRDVMRTPPATATLQTRLLHIRQMILQHDMSAVPVMDEGRFVGVVGVDEIARVFLKYYELSRGEPKRTTPLKFLVAADAITLRPPRVDPDASLAEAASLMARRRYRAVVVVDADKPVGIITGIELVRALLGR
jgi:CBS domain-containing protein